MLDCVPKWTQFNQNPPIPRFGHCPRLPGRPQEPPCWNGQVVAFLGDGKGDFSAPPQPLLGSTPASISGQSIADFNGLGTKSVLVFLTGPPCAADTTIVAPVPATTELE